jgi:hypothetical protein
MNALKEPFLFFGRTWIGIRLFFFKLNLFQPLFWINSFFIAVSDTLTLTGHCATLAAVDFPAFWRSWIANQSLRAISFSTAEIESS